jgi:hypothetical protein
VPINCSLPRPSPKMLGIRYLMEVNLIGDSKETLRTLILHLICKEDRSWREKIEGEVSRWWRAPGALQPLERARPQAAGRQGRCRTRLCERSFFPLSGICGAGSTHPAALQGLAGPGVKSLRAPSSETPWA